MGRRLLCGSFLYVAPPNLDFSLPSHSTKRWQRRWFSLFEDGELRFAIDDNPETVPQAVLNMSKCIRVCIADAITHHSHSLLIAFQNEYFLSETKREDSHPAICYVKADTTEQIRLWQSLLQNFANKNAAQIVPMREILDSDSPVPCTSESLQICPFRTRSETPSHSSNDGILKEDPPSLVEDFSVPPLNEYEEPLDFQPKDAENLSENMPFQIDTSMHTLRKGWLMLRGKNETEWRRHWVVLAGLDLKVYNDVWVEENTVPVLSIDLSECENVYPSASTKNYGIEIKCKKGRHILSAMTPGIRDSWITALQQNLHNPSPTYPEFPTVATDALSQADSADIHSITRRRKHIAYVAPSQHSNSLLDGDFSSSTEAEGDDEGNLRDSASVMPTVDIPDSNIHIIMDSHAESSSISSTDEHEARQNRRYIDRSNLPSRATEHNRTRLRTSHAMRLSVSPSKRSSPVNRVKERNHSRRAAGDGFASPADSLRRSPQLENRPLEDQVNNLRSQLGETRQRMNQLESENGRLRNVFGSNNLDHLRQCLTAAEADLIRQQDEMDSLRWRLDSANLRSSQSINSPSADIFPAEIGRRLVSLLKVQVGVLSKVLHSSNSATSFLGLRHYVDDLIRRVAALDENSPQQLALMENVFEEVIAAYEKLGGILERRNLGASWAVSEANNQLSDKLRSLEKQIEETKNEHAVELVSQRSEYESQLGLLKAKIEFEEKERSRLEAQLNALSPGQSEESLELLKTSYEESISELRKQFEMDLEALRREHEAELEEEKQATKLALDVVHRAHCEEIQRVKNSGNKSDFCRNCQSELLFGSPIRRSNSPKQRETVESLTTELSNMSALYSAKCAENAQLEAKIQEILTERENKQTVPKSPKWEKRKQIKAETKVKEENTEQENVVNGSVLERNRSTSVRFRPPNGAASRRIAANRRTDIRFHSNPVIPVFSVVIKEPSEAALSAELVDEVRRSLTVPVSERRKFFERVAEYNGPF